MADRFTLVWTAHFARTAKKFAQGNPGLKTRFARVLRDLERDPFAPHLKLHHLKGALAGLQAVSITHGYRLTLTLKITAKEIILLDVGSHDVVYR